MGEILSVQRCNQLKSGSIVDLEFSFFPDEYFALVLVKENQIRSAFRVKGVINLLVLFLKEKRSFLIIFTTPQI